MQFVIAHSSLHWLEPALFAFPTLGVLVAIVRERRRRGADVPKES
jgi:hypothetical protein